MECMGHFRIEKNEIYEKYDKINDELKKAIEELKIKVKEVGHTLDDNNKCEECGFCLHSFFALRIMYQQDERILTCEEYKIKDILE